MSVFSRLVAWVALIASAGIATVASAASFRVTDLSAQFPNASGFQLNNAGHIMGQVNDAQSPASRYTFIYANGVSTRLAAPPQSSALAVSFNDNDDMTGNFVRYAADGVTIVGSGIFLYKNGQFTDITAALPHSQNGTAIQAINNAGVLMGNYSYHSFTVWLYDTVNGRDAGIVLNSYNNGYATALNSESQATGKNFYSGIYHAFLSGSGGGEIGSFSATPRDQNDHSEGLGINDLGQVVGRAGTPSGYSHAFVYDHGALTDLGTLGNADSVADDINNAGVIVGASATSAGIGHAFIYESKRMLDINTLIDPADPLASGVVFTEATSINDRGEILATGQYASGQTATFLLTPVQTSADNAYYNFEQTIQEWFNSGENIVSLTRSSTQQFAGASSLTVQFNGSGYVSVGAMSPPSLAGKTVSFHIYIPAGATIQWIQPFAQEGDAGGWAWHGNWQPISNVQLGAWNTITLDVPADATPITRIGVELYTSQPYTGTVNIDSVSF